MKGVGEQARGIPISDSTGGATDDHRAASPATRPPGAAGVGDPGSPGEGTDGAVDRILTVPNAITLVRLACIPLFLWLLFGAGRQTAAAVLLGALGATDWVDGYVARRFHQVSTWARCSIPWPTGCWWSRR